MVNSEAAGTTLNDLSPDEVRNHSRLTGKNKENAVPCFIQYERWRGGDFAGQPDFHIVC